MPVPIIPDKLEVKTDKLSKGDPGIDMINSCKIVKDGAAIKKVPKPIEQAMPNIEPIALLALLFRESNWDGIYLLNKSDANKILMLMLN